MTPIAYINSRGKIKASPGKLGPDKPLRGGRKQAQSLSPYKRNNIFRGDIKSHRAVGGNRHRQAAGPLNYIKRNKPCTGARRSPASNRPELQASAIAPHWPQTGQNINEAFAGVGIIARRGENRMA